MAVPSSDIGRTVTADFYKPEQSGYKPGVKGTIIGYLIKFDKELPGINTGWHYSPPQKYGLVSNEGEDTIPSREKDKFMTHVGKITAMAGGRRRRNRTRRNRRN